MSKIKATSASEEPGNGMKTVHKGLPINGMADLVTVGQLLSQTKMFGTINPADGFIIASICYQYDLTYDEFAETYNVMHGRLSKKTDAILCDLYTLGGKHKPIERTSAVAKAEFTFGGNTYTSEVKFDDLKKEPFIYSGKEEDILRKIAAGQFNQLQIKGKYQTERSRMQMLWARCVSDGVRVICPAACKGIYTPEETSDFADEATVVAQPLVAVPSSPEAPSPFVPPAAAGDAASVEICPCGALKGKRWDSLDVSVLGQALDVEHPLFTKEMKDYIYSIITKKNAEVANV